MQPARLPMFLVAALLPAAAAAAQLDWTNRTPVAGPPPVGNPGLCHDAARNQTVLFGGYDGSSSLAETWLWNGNAWARVLPALSPPARDYHAMAFDSMRNRAVLFGGWDTVGTPLGDTWEWDGNQWSQGPSSQAPQARFGTRMSFDLARGRMVLFGGYDGATTFGDTWEYDGTAWRLASAGGPPARDGHGQAFDLARNRTLVFGGQDAAGTVLGDTWVYDGSAGIWSQQMPTAAPAPRTYVAMAYDTGRARTVLFGGTDLGAVNNFNDTWDWNGSTWSQAAPATVPGARDSHAMAFDSGRGRTVMFGGLDFQLIESAEVWEYGSAPAASYGGLGTGCAGSAGVPALAAMPGSLPRIGATFAVGVGNLPIPGTIFMTLGFSNATWNGMTLPASLQPFGMPGCTVYGSVDAAVLVLGSGGVAVWTLPVPNNQGLVGLSFWNQAVAIDPAAGNPAGAVVSNAGQGRIGP